MAEPRVPRRLVADVVVHQWLAAKLAGIDDGDRTAIGRAVTTIERVMSEPT